MKLLLLALIIFLSPVFIDDPTPTPAPTPLRSNIFIPCGATLANTVAVQGFAHGYLAHSQNPDVIASMLALEGVALNVEVETVLSAATAYGYFTAILDDGSIRAMFVIHIPVGYVGIVMSDTYYDIRDLDGTVADCGIWALSTQDVEMISEILNDEQDIGESG